MIEAGTELPEQENAETLATAKRRRKKKGTRNQSLTFFLRRGGMYIGLFIATVVLNFILPRLIPGDPAQQQIFALTQKLGRPPGPLEVQSILDRYGDPNENIFVSFFKYVGKLFSGDWGLSTYFYPQPVVEVIFRAMPWTIYLGLASTLIGWIVGTYLGIKVGWKPGGKFDAILTPIAMFIGRITPFWLAILIVVVFSYTLQWFPGQGAYNTALTVNFLDPIFLLSVLVYSILPLFTLVLVGFAQTMFSMRNMMITTINEDYVQLARAKGLSAKRVRNSYAARNAILPSITALAGSMGGILFAVVLAEGVFAYPGVGQVLGVAEANRDYPLLQGILLVTTIFTLVFAFIMDSVYGLLDPRIRES